MKPPTRRFRASRFAGFLVLLVACGSFGHAQGVVIHSDAYASSGGNSFKNVVRNADGTLYCVSIRETVEGNREVVAQSSEDEGQTWDEGLFVFNDEATGLTPPETTNGCAVAIDDRGALHVTWGNYFYPSSYRQLYRNWNPTTGDASEIFDISAWTGAARTSRTAAMDIAVDEQNTVWIVAHGPQSWVERLMYSPAPYAEGMEFVDVGNISPSASAQTTRIAVDPIGRVHCAFYRNTGAGQFEHRIFDPASGWSESTNLGNTTPENDIWGVLAADGLGYVHVLFGEDATDNSALWKFLYRRWDEDSGWGEPVTLMEVEKAQRTDIANTHIVSLGCDESTGEVTVLYRDLSRGGPLGVVRKALDDAGFGEFVELAPATVKPHAYYSPAIRGRLFPASDRTSHGLHLTWQHRAESGVPPYSLQFSALGGAVSPRFRRGETDDSGLVTISDAIFGLTSLFIADSPQPTCVDAADANDDGEFNLTDAVYTLNALFLGGESPPAPGMDDCGSDSTDDELDCERYLSC